jgi:lactate permease
LALIGNTAPVAFGALGTPVLALARITELPLMELSQMVGRQLPFFSLLVPFWLVCAMVGWRQMLRVWPACLTAGGSFGLVQFAVSNWHGPWLVDIAGSVASIVSLVVLLRFWRPPAIDAEKLAHVIETEVDGGQERADASVAKASGGWQPALRALMPWIILTVMVSAWGVPAINKMLEQTTPKFAIPGLHMQVQRMPPVVDKPTAEKAEFELKWLSATGTALLITGILSGACLGLGPVIMLALFLRTLRRTAASLATIAAMLALGFTTRYSGLDATMGLAMASTGWMFPFFSPLLGWLGVALTGSDTASNVLFGNLQKITAQRVGISPVLAAAANSSGGVMGKMIDAQSIVVAGVATGQHGQEGQILRYVFLHSLSLAILVGLLVALQAYFF